MANRRQRLIVIAIAVVAAIAAGIGLFALGRSTIAPPMTTPAPSLSPMSPMPPTPSVDPTPAYEPTDPSGSPEPALPGGAATAGQGGTKTGPGGLPLGYSHDETGAVNAATNYLIWMNSLKITDKKLADEMAAAAAADAATRRNLTESFDLLRDGMRDLTVDEPQPNRGAFAVAEFASNRALIYVWGPKKITDNNDKTEHVWSIDGVSLQWVDGDWKLTGALVSTVGQAAVDPVDPAGNPSAEEKNSILRRTPADSGEITDAADQTWLEYRNAAR